MAPKRFAKTSTIWNFFTEKPDADRVAICNMCNHELSFKSTSHNLRKHIERKHGDLEIAQSPFQKKKIKLDWDEIPGPSESDEENLNFQVKIEKLDASETFPTTAVCRKKIDDSLMKLFTVDFQPFSIVEDQGFKNFVFNLNPSYQLPARKTITKTLLPAAYEEVYNFTKTIVPSIKSLTLTVDCWTSTSTENFFAVTAHYVDPNDFQIKNVLLECVSFPESHTSLNIAAAMRKVIEEWNLEGKILMVVSDNAANIKKAIEDDLKLTHFGCYAHTINLIVQDSMVHSNHVVNKIKTVIGHFKRSTIAMSQLIEQQKQLNMVPKKLIQDVSTRWNSTFYMVERFIELEEPLKRVMGILDKNFPMICFDEWAFMKELITILKPMETVTNLMSGEKIVTASSVIVITDGLRYAYKELDKKTRKHLSKEIIKSILQGIQNRLGDLESHNSLTLSTFLDPRYKNLGFSSDFTSNKVKNDVISLVSEKVPNKKGNTTENLENGENEDDVNSLIWGNFNKKISNFRPSNTVESTALIEVQRYLEEPLINRTEDPLKWWKEQSHNFPHLSEIVKQKFVTAATSVPCERLFSKSEQLLSDRRNRLSSTKVKQILFLNSQKNLTD